jgi:protein-S-isoprenylcysteine O-methyltransferase Ste14
LHIRVMEKAPSPFWAKYMPTKSVQLDLLERIIVIVMFCMFASLNLKRFLLTHDMRSLMLVISETLPLVLVALRPPSPTLSEQPLDWLVGLGGTIFPLLVVAGGALNPLLPIALCFSIIIFGLFIQIAAKVALGRSFGLIAANRGVKSSGPYRFVRHPMYAGYTVAHIGIFLSFPSLRNAALYSLALAFQVFRIAREERVLMQDPDYRALAGRVRYRLVPGIF